MHASTVFVIVSWCACIATPAAADDPLLNGFRERVLPVLEDNCFACHGNGLNKGGVTFPGADASAEFLRDRVLWQRVLKNVRAGIMPPADKPRPSDEERAALDAWIKYDAFGIDRANPDPGRATLRRLNRVEYGNTIRDLMGYDFRAEEEFPPDDTGYGFDTISEVLTVSPLLLEKYLQAARSIVTDAVPVVAKVVRQRKLDVGEFHDSDGKRVRNRTSFYQDVEGTRTFRVDEDGEYDLIIDFAVRSGFDYDPGRCELKFTVDGQEVDRRELTWASGKRHQVQSRFTWQPGERTLAFAVHALSSTESKKHDVDVVLEEIRVVGPLDPARWISPKNYERFFFKGEPPQALPDRKDYARAILEHFAKRAFRRPIGSELLERLQGIVEAKWAEPGQTFESGVAQGLIAILASPRFVFRIEEVDPADAGAGYPMVDEWALASRLSYFLWSTMPDEELLDLAEKGALRTELQAQIRRMLADDRFGALVENFVGQWLQTRDIEGVSINPGPILRRDGTRGQRIEFDRDLRLAMKQETEMLFDYIARQDRGILELIDCDYTFLNERLAKHYGIDGVRGERMRRVDLPGDSPRGGILTHGTFLAVTSNPTRTSPVKRGLYVLDNILGTPAPPPPADVPLLEEAEKEFADHEPTLREVLETHRRQPLCHACHARMDPIGLALENYNAMGMWREKDRGQPIDPAGQLITGEAFRGVAELKKILVFEHRLNYYRCLTEKLLTYAIGRGLEYYDTETTDRIVAKLQAEDGRFSALLMGVVESSPFQRRRRPDLQSSDAAARSDHSKSRDGVNP